MAIIIARTTNVSLYYTCLAGCQHKLKADHALILGGDSLRCLALATVDEPRRKEDMNLTDPTQFIQFEVCRLCISIIPRPLISFCSMIGRYFGQYVHGATHLVVNVLYFMLFL